MTGEWGGRLSSIGESIGDALLERAGRVSARVQERQELASDVLESDDTYRVVFDVPGATGSDVQVRYVDGGVSIRVDRFREFHEGYEMRFPGRGLSLDGRAELPEEAVVEADRAEATLTQKGTLEIDLPKRADAPARTEYEPDDGMDLDARVETVDRTDDSGDADDGGESEEVDGDEPEGVDEDADEANGSDPDGEAPDGEDDSSEEDGIGIGNPDAEEDEPRGSETDTEENGDESTEDDDRS